MQFEDIAHKYKLKDVLLPPSGANVALWKLDQTGRIVAIVGWFRDETIARNVALSLEFYKEKNKIIDGVLQDDKSN